EIVDVPQCPIATPEINAKLPEVRARTHARLAAGEYKRDATLLLRHAQEGVITDYDAVIHERVGPLKLHFLARDFFQNNPFILPAFTDYVREQAAGSGAKFLVDAYCGSGLFALSCAPAFEKVAGIELSATSVKFATENAAANGIANATFRAGDAAQIFAGLDFPPADTAVVIDPPRKGCDESFLNQLFAYGPRAVVYVSCDPATQMRDLKGFLTAGYRLTAVQPFDLFPQTRHLECVITLFR
ncbi:MAG: methyltransferase domain-containing protein, partial [Oleiharenicola lentus]